MAQATITRVNRLAWVDLASADAEASRDFYAKLFGWKLDVNPDPLYGGYALAKLGDQDVGGIGPTQSPDQPTAWSLYVGTDDAAALDAKVQAAGGTVIAPAFDVGDLGKMAVYQDPSGAFFSGWQPSGMGTFRHGVANSLGWAELNSRGLEKAIPFYQQVFGWTTKVSPMGEGQGDYTEFQVDGDSIAGALEIGPMQPAELPSYWMAYFDVDDVDSAYAKALGLGAHEMVAPADYPGGRFAIVSDPQGAVFGLLKVGSR
jgi:predicted enzyme related to lactoylglutathione lyase